MHETLRPNVVLIMADQLRPDFLGCYGAGFARTPNIDALAARSIVYRNAISPTPICVSARASLHIGANSMATGVTNNMCWIRPDHDQIGLPGWPRLLAGLGYHTEAIGKMHFSPWDAVEGFTHRVIAEDKRHALVEDDYHDFLAAGGRQKYELLTYERSSYMCATSKLGVEDQIDHWVGTQACDFIERFDGDTPFAAFVSFPSPHDPYDPPAELLANYDPADMPDPLPATAETARMRDAVIAMHRSKVFDTDLAEFPLWAKQKMRAHYAALVELVDIQVGRIVRALEATGRMENTVIIVCSDHGDFLGDFDLAQKMLYFEPSIAIPLIVRVPGHPRIRRDRNELVTVSDLFATMVSIAAGETYVGAQDSFVLPGIGSEGSPMRHSALGAFAPGGTVAALPSGFLLARGMMRLMKYSNGVHALYDLCSDPGQQNNLYELPAYRDVRLELDSALVESAMSAQQFANADKQIPFGVHTRGHSFPKRAWQRSFPARFDG